MSMLRRSILVITFLLLLSGITTAQNRPYGWTAWLHYGRHMTLVNQSGESLREVDLPLPKGYYVNSRNLAVSSSGRWVAYLVQQSENTAQVLVYDTENALTIVQYPLEADGIIWESSWFGTSDQIFNEHETVVAFGYTIYYPGDINTGDWRLIALDLATGKPDYELRGADLIQRGLIENYIWTPIVRRFQGTEITFTLDILENEGNPNTFIWNTASGEVRPTLNFPNQESELFAPTGEVIAPMFAGGHPLPVPYLEDPSRTLDVYDPIIGGRYPFYQFESGRPQHASFIQNGERLLMYSTNSWVLLGRDGVVLNRLDLAPNLPIYSLKGVPDGFLYTSGLLLPQEAVPVAVPALVMVNTRDNRLTTGQAVWHLSMADYSKQTGDSKSPLKIVWVHSDAPVGPFIPWAQLTPPVYEPTPIPSENLPQPTMLPTPEPLFQVGMTVTVQTTGGEILNLRVDHTRKAEVIMYLEDDMQLTLLEGPIEAEGYTWWRVRTEDDIEGWTVENNGELQTLVPG